MRIAQRMESIPFSGIRKVFEEVIRREKAGERIIHLNIGRPDFDTPKNIKEAAKKALDEGKVHYGSNYGIMELREAIARKTERENRVSYDPASEIIVTVGANEGVLLAMMALLNPGDEVLIPDPVWLHYFYCARMAGAVPVSVPTKEENEFVPQIDDFRSLISPKTKMVVLTSPNNPTGTVAGKDALEALARLVQEKDLFVISDEIYEAMVYDGSRHISIATLSGMKQRTIIVNGFSKRYSMTGWRLGWIAADKDLVSAMIRIHQYTTVCATTFAQWGAVEALSGPQDEVQRMIEEFDRRRKLVFNALKEMPGVRVSAPKGAFYIFPNIQGTGKSCDELTGYLLDEAKIAVVPGSVFGKYGHGYLRISYANSYENLEKAMNNMLSALRKLL
ncbi:MAG: pyridoxal phosphate-dependent aminotransferase [Deltaproteobacteria bacterium]|nr:pyridoxal phosphate-dependent aminotransferase [Deltaproteobacteria bacterium]MBW1995488.1 pyridoxal phosphate-dependent aminotransferase [Deltaproteobacteria bacterium]MBW2150940.1 pyridoxal phosphate-dependent aminotransferase [Deltaproteobacteria bacterium]